MEHPVAGLARPQRDVGWKSYGGELSTSAKQTGHSTGLRTRRTTWHDSRTSSGSRRDWAQKFTGAGVDLPIVVKLVIPIIRAFRFRFGQGGSREIDPSARRALGRFINNRTRMHPMVMPVVLGAHEGQDDDGS